MAQAVGKVGIELEARVGKLESDLKKVGQVVEREAHKWGKAMKQGLTSVEAETKRAADAAEAHAKRISNSFKAAFAGFTVGASLKMLSRTADEYANIAARIKLAAGANADFGRSFGQVFKVAQSTYQSLDATTRLVQKISQGLQTTGLGYQESFQKAIQLTEVFNKALVVSGAGTIQAQSAMLQFSQAIAKGRLDGDEFRSVMENNSAFMLLLAKSLGVSTGALYKLREEGKLTTDVLMQVTQNSEYLQKLYEQFPPTIARASQQWSNAMTKFIGESDQAVGASRTIAEAISFLARNIDTLADSLLGVFAIMGASKGFGVIAAGVAAIRSEIGKTAAANAIWNDMKQSVIAAAGAQLQLAKAKEVETAKTLEAIRVARLDEQAKLASSRASVAAGRAAVAAAEAEVAAIRKVAAAQGEALVAQTARLNPALSGAAAASAMAKTNRMMQEGERTLQALAAASTNLAQKQAVLKASTDAQAAAMSSLAMLGKQQKGVLLEQAAAQTQMMLATKTATGATDQLIKPMSLAQKAMTGLKIVGSGLLSLLGGWPGVIAAAAYATYLWANRETEAQAAAKKTEDAIYALEAAHTSLEQARATADVVASFNEQIKVVERLRAEFEKYEAAAEAAAAANDESAQMSFQLAMADTASALKNAQEKLVGTWRKMLDVGVATRDTSSVLGRFNSVVADMADPLAIIVGLLDEVKDKAQEVSEIDFVGAGKSTKELEKSLQEENQKLAEQIVRLRGGEEAANAFNAAQTKLSEKTRELSRVNAGLKNELEATKEAQKASDKALKDGERPREKATKDADRLAEAQKRNAIEARKLANELGGPLEIAWANMQKAIEKWQLKLEKGETTIQDYATAVRGLVGIFLEEKDAIEASAAALAKRQDILGRTIEDNNATAAGFGLTGRAAFVYAQVLDRAAEALSLFQEKQRASPELSDEERAGIEASAGALYDLGIAYDNLQQIMEDAQQIVIDFAYGVGDAFTTFAVDVLSNVDDIDEAWENLGDSLVDTAKRAVGEMISQFLKLQIINPILNSIFGGFGGNVLPTQGNLLGNITSMFNGGGIGRLFGGGGGGTGASMLPALAALAGGAFGLTNRGSSTGSAGSIAAAGAYGYAGYALGTVGYGAALGASGALAGGASAAAGATSGALGAAGAIPVAGWIIAAIAAIDMITGGKVFGTRYRAESGTTSLNLSEEGGSASQTIREVRQRALFGGRQWRNRSVTASDEAVEAAQQLFDNVRGVMTDAARALNGEAPAMIDAALRTVVEYDKKGKVKATKYFVDLMGRTWEEETAEAATQRIMAESMIATIDSILGTTVEAASTAAGAATGDVVAGAGAGVARGIGEVTDVLAKTVAVAQGEASAIAERWRGDAATLMDGAQMLLAAATDIRRGAGLLGEGGTLTQVADLIEDLQEPGEALAATYQRVAASAALLDEALGLAGVSLDRSREEIVRFAVDITEAAGGLERAQQLWSSYFENFYSESERAALALSRADAGARRQFQDIGLNAEDFMGEGGGQAFRDLFESLLPTLSAEAIVQWLEAAEALGIYIDAFEEYNNSLGSVEVDNSLAEFMAGIRDELASFDQELTYAQQVSEINKEIDGLIVRAQSLGASEQDIADIRALGQARLNALAQQHLETLREQAQAQQNLDNLILLLTAETAGPLSELTGQLMGLRREYQGHVDQLNEYARAAGRAGASQEELAVASEWYAARLRQIADGLIQTGRSLVQRLYGGQGSEAETPIGMGTTWYNNETGGISEINEAVEDRYAREMELLEQLRNYLDSLKLSALSPYTPEERLMEAQRQYQSILARAQGGDLDALAQLQEAANTYLGEAQSYYGGVGAYGGIFDSVMGAIQGLVDRGPLNSPPEEGPTEVTGIGGGNIQVDPGEGFAALGELERQALAAELATVMRDIMILTGDSLLQVSEQLGVDLVALVADLGVNLDEMTVATTLQLATISNQLGVDLTELATAVGFHLGQLGDEQSLLNDALETVIAGLPEGIGNDLSEYLTAIEAATIDGDPNAALEDMQNYINSLPAGIRTQLAPFFEGVGTPEQLLLAATIDIGNDILALKTSTLNIESSASSLADTLFRVEGILSSHGGLLAEVNALLERIAENTTPEAPEPPPPPTPEEAPEYIGEYEDSDGVVVELRSMKAEISAALKMIATSSKDVSDSNRTIAKAVTTNAGPRGKM